MEPKAKIGFPDNPLTRTARLFPDNYLVTLNGGLKRLRERAPKADLIELHFQLFEELPKNTAKLESYVKKARSRGFSFVAHAPFLKDKNKGRKYRALNFDMVWPVVPEALRRRPIMNIEDITICAIPAKRLQITRLLDVLDHLDIRICTMHLSRPGTRFSRKDWTRVQTFLRWLKREADKKHITIAIETGGVDDKELLDCVRLGHGVNFDSAHYFLDMVHEGMTPNQADAATFKAFRNLAKHIKVMHLTQTYADRDSHLTILDKRGALKCNERIIKLAAKTGITNFILETLPDPKGTLYVDRLVRHRHP